MVISAWQFLLQQSLCAWGLLAAASSAAGLRLPPLRTVMLSISSALLCFFTLHILYLRMLVFLFLCAWTPLVLWPRTPRRTHLRLSLSLGVLTCLLAGVGRMLLSLSLPPGWIPLCAALTMPLIVRMHTGTASPPCATVEIHLYRRHVLLTALVDSGNLLRDPLTSLPVIVISRKAAARLTDLPAADTLPPGMRLISVRTIAGTALMPVFRPTLVRIRLGAAWQTVQAAIGLSPDGYDGYQALMPASLASPAAPTSLQGGFPL